jgi:hypothetical protein
MILPIMAVSLALTAPAFAQNRFMEQAREAADRRAENKAIREAEYPADEPTRAEPANPAQAAPGTAAPAQTPASAQ